METANDVRCWLTNKMLVQKEDSVWNIKLFCSNKDGSMDLAVSDAQFGSDPTAQHSQQWLASRRLDQIDNLRRGSGEEEGENLGGVKAPDMNYQWKMHAPSTSPQCVLMV